MTFLYCVELLAAIVVLSVLSSLGVASEPEALPHQRILVSSGRQFAKTLNAPASFLFQDSDATFLIRPSPFPLPPNAYSLGSPGSEACEATTFSSATLLTTLTPSISSAQVVYVGDTDTKLLLLYMSPSAEKSNTLDVLDKVSLNCVASHTLETDFGQEVQFEHIDGILFYGSSDGKASIECRNSETLEYEWSSQFGFQGPYSSFTDIISLEGDPSRLMLVGYTHSPIEALTSSAPSKKVFVAELSLETKDITNVRYWDGEGALLFPPVFGSDLALGYGHPLAVIYDANTDALQFDLRIDQLDLDFRTISTCTILPTPVTFTNTLPVSLSRTELPTGDQFFALGLHFGGSCFFFLKHPSLNILTSPQTYPINVMSTIPTSLSTTLLQGRPIIALDHRENGELKTSIVVICTGS